MGERDGTSDLKVGGGTDGRKFRSSSQNEGGTSQETMGGFWC